MPVRLSKRESPACRKAARRGAVLMMVAVMSMMLVGLLAIAIDMSRAYAQKNEMQTSADAAALAGVLELFVDTTLVDNTAIAFGRSNRVQTVSLPAGHFTVTCGFWNDTLNANVAFSPSAHCGAADNAVQVTVIDTVQYSFNGMFNLARRQQTTRSTAWMGYIVGARCVKPWAMRYSVLTRALQPANNDDLRDLTEQDQYLLATLPRSQRRFLLHNIPPPTEPGNFGALDIPNQATNASGAELYRTNIETCNSRVIRVGDIVSATTGGMGINTWNAADDFCPGFVSTDNQWAECRNAEGRMGELAIAALWSSAGALIGNSQQLTVRQLVSFTLDSVSRSGEIIGTFIPTSFGGSVGSTPSTIRRPIIVK